MSMDKKENGERSNLTNMNQHFNYILKYCNYNQYNVENGFVIQLFCKENFANDEVDCIAEFDGETIQSVILQAIEYIDEYVR